jgi:hypothetical protein
MPVLILILKMGIIMSFITTTQISFTDDRIFPSSKRNTSVGTCGMIARSVTIVAPIVNEWDVPYPILIMLGFTIIGLINTFFFPHEEEKLKSELYGKLGEKAQDDSYISYHEISEDRDNKSTKSK